MKYQIEFEEKRAIRRQIINDILHEKHYLEKHGTKNKYTLSYIRLSVQLRELRQFGEELQAYRDFKP